MSKVLGLAVEQHRGGSWVQQKAMARDMLERDVPRTFWKTMTKDILTGSNGRGAPGWGRCVPILRQGLSPGPGPRVCSSLCSGSHCSFGAAFGRAGPQRGVASAGLAQGSACAAMATRDAKLPLKSPNKQILHTTKRKPPFSPCCPQPVFSLGTC